MSDSPTAASLTSGGLQRTLWRLAGPMFVSALLQNAQTLIDLFWVGRLGSEAVAALAISGTILMLVFPLAMGLSTGTLALVSRRMGAGQPEAASDIAVQSIMVALTGGVITGVAGWAVTHWLTNLMGASGQVQMMADDYLRISFAGFVTVYILIIGNSAAQAAGNARIPMQVMLLANTLNLVLDPLFIFGAWGIPGGGVRGAAIATVLAQAIAAAVILWRLRTGIGLLRLPCLYRRADGAILETILRIGLPTALQMFSRSLMAFVLMRFVTRFGTATVAAYGIGMRLHMILLMPAFTLGNAAAAIVGQNLGAGQPDRAARAGWLAAGTAAAILCAGGSLLALLAPLWVACFDRSPDVVAIGIPFLRWVSPFYTFAALGIVLSRCLQGAGDPVPPMVFTIVSLWGLQIPAAWYLPYVITPPVYGIWYAIAAALTLNGASTTFWFLLGRWKHRRL